MYRSHFGLNESPFSVTPDPRFIYNSAIYDEVLGKLRYGIEAKKGFIVVSGEAGTGKTTLLRRLMRSFSDRVAYAYIFNPRLKFTSLLRAILKDLGVPAKALDKESMLEQVNEYLLRQHKQGRIVAWIFDEAQGLSDDVLEELRLLGNLETDSEKLVQIILVGQPELESRLDRAKLSQLKQRIAHRHVMHPLTPDEVAPYLAARLAQAGYKGGELFSPNAVDLIAGYSRGIPRVINSLCDNALVRGCQAGTKTITPELIDAAAEELRLGMKLRSEPNRPLENVGVANETPNRGAPSIVEADDAPLPSVSDDLPLRAPFAVNKKQLRFAVGALMMIAVLAWGVAVSWPPGTELAVSHVNHPAPAVGQALPVSATGRAAAAPSGNRATEAEKNLHEPTVAAPALAGVTPESDSQPAEPQPNQQSVVADAGTAVKPPARKIFRVSESSFLRNKPAANADIVDTLRPGMSVEVTSLGGEFLRVRSLGGESVQGFVHKEDAFFEPLH